MDQEYRSPSPPEHGPGSARSPSPEFLSAIGGVGEPDHPLFNDFDEEERLLRGSDNPETLQFEADEEEEHPPSPMLDDILSSTSKPVVHPEMIEALKFVQMLEDATLESQLSPEDLDALRNPRAHSSTPSNDPDLLLSISNFIDLMTSSQEAYDRISQNIRRRDPTIETLSYDRVRRMVQKLSGVIALKDDMCVESCVAFTGPFAKLESCPLCRAPRYDPVKLEKSGGEIKIPQKEFTTFLAGPQIQARWKHPDTAEKMLYRQMRTSEGETGGYDDIFSGEAYLDAVKNGEIKDYDTVLMLSIDGAQLYRDKKSECWIYIWILLELAPDQRYKVRNILPGGIIPGPTAPEHLDSFLFPGLAHVSALQKEGLRLWDSYNRRLVCSYLFLLLVLADAVAMAKLTGSVGHHGRKGCRLLCDLMGRNKKGGSHYYPALLRPIDCDDNPSASHPDIDINDLPPTGSSDVYRQNLNYLLTSPTESERKRRRLQTGITKPSIFDGLPRILELPGCFPGDLMHQPIINLPGLLFDLWCERRDLRKHDKDSDWPWAVLTGKVWEEHGKVVANAGRFLPRSFDRVPRNPQEKISSGYKACEFLIYVYVLGPGLFYGVLPDPYYRHFCKLVRGIRLIHQRRSSEDQLKVAHQTLLEFCIEFEHIYYQRQPNRLHFVRQSIHSLTHLGPETHRLGPLSLSAQWTMERMIGVLGSLIKQPSNMFANLTEQAKKMANVNALLAMWPEIGHDSHDPRGSINLGGGYILLRPKDDKPYLLTSIEQIALASYCATLPESEGPVGRSVYRWGRLQIPNGQPARSYWKEVDRSSKLARTDRMLKVRSDLDIRVLLLCMYDVYCRSFTKVLPALRKRVSTSVLASTLAGPSLSSPSSLRKMKVSTNTLAESSLSVTITVTKVWLL